MAAGSPVDVTATIRPGLAQFVRSSHLTPAVDKQFFENGKIRAIGLSMVSWANELNIPQFTCELIEESGRSPMIFGVAPGTIDGTLMFNFHFDKLPPTGKWTSDPHELVERDGWLFGNGVVDDGYAFYSFMTALSLIGAQDRRTVIVLGGSDEFVDMPYWIERLTPRFPSTPDAVLILDGPTMSYDQLWYLTSTLGSILGTLTVKVAEDKMHSGLSNRIIPDPFRLIKQITNRVEDSFGKVNPAFSVQIPSEVFQTIRTLGWEHANQFNLPVIPTLQLEGSSVEEQIVLNSWTAGLVVAAQKGMADTESCGGVRCGQISVKLELRCPPTLQVDEATRKLSEMLVTDPPHGAEVTWKETGAFQGWYQPRLNAWTEAALNQSSRQLFDSQKPAQPFFGPGSSPPIKLFSQLWPNASMLLIGAAGPGTNMHTGDECINIEYLNKITYSIKTLLTYKPSASL